MELHCKINSYDRLLKPYYREEWENWHGTTRPAKVVSSSNSSWPSCRIDSTNLQSTICSVEEKPIVHNDIIVNLRAVLDVSIDLHGLVRQISISNLTVLQKCQFFKTKIVCCRSGGVDIEGIKLYFGIPHPIIHRQVTGLVPSRATLNILPFSFLWPFVY